MNEREKDNTRAALLVAGLGNTLMSDEAAGVLVARRLAERLGVEPGIDIVEMETGGVGLVHQLAGRRKAVIADCALMGERPGTLRRFTPEEARSRKIVTGQSQHEGDVLAIIDLARRLGDAPEEIAIFGIEPEKIAPGEGLSPPLQKRMEEYVDIISREIAGSTPADR
jgi:hydrogenase maturation protease